LGSGPPTVAIGPTSAMFPHGLNL